MEKALELSKEFLEKNIEDFNESDTKILQKLIEYHSDLYYNKENPIISDYEYDQLFKKLEILEEKFNLEKKQSLQV
jgi:DNA ligase (NAD+)